MSSFSLPTLNHRNSYPSHPHSCHPTHLYLVVRDVCTGVLQCRGINSANARVALTNSFVVSSHPITSHPSSIIQPSILHVTHISTPIISFHSPLLSLTLTHSITPLLFSFVSRYYGVYVWLAIFFIEYSVWEKTSVYTPSTDVPTKDFSTEKNPFFR